MVASEYIPDRGDLVWLQLVIIPQDLPIEGVILADQVKSLDWQSRQAAFICRVPQDNISEVIAKLTFTDSLTGKSR